MTDGSPALPSSVKWLTWIGVIAFGGGVVSYLAGRSALPGPWEAMPLLIAGIGAIILGVTHRRVRPYLRS